MSAMAVEKRSEPRFRVLLRSKLVYGDGLISIDATVKNSSPHGALLTLTQPQALPDNLFLLDLRAGVAHEAHVAWRRLPQIGVQFTRTHKLDHPATPELRVLRRMWLALATP